MAEQVRFPSTIWSTIHGARNGDPSALREIFEDYRQPVMAFLRKSGVSDSDVEDLTQEAFAIICRDSFLKKVDPRKGRFRSLVLGVTKNVCLLRRRHTAAQKRGGKSTILSAEELSDAGIELQVPVDQSQDIRDPEFDFCWIQNLVTRALRKLREESEAKGGRAFEALELFIGGKSYEEIARTLRWEVDHVRSQIFHARAKLKKYVQQLIMDYSANLEEYEREREYLWNLLASRK